MACINTDGSITYSARKVLQILHTPQTFAEVAESTGLPRYRIRASLRDLNAAGLLSENEGNYVLTKEGADRLLK